MPDFAFVARDAGGGLVQGSLSAASSAEVARQLRGEGKYPLKVSQVEAAAAPAAAPATGGRGRPRREDLLHFANQLTIMVETGVPLSEALDGCRNPEGAPAFQRVLAQVIDDVHGGSTFSAALGNQAKHFPPVMVSMVRASEASGTLGLMLRRVTDFMVNQHELNRKIRGALVYPVAMLSFALGVTAFLVTYVLPKFTKIYVGRESTLPKLTRVLMGGSDVLKAHWMSMLAAVAVVVVGLVLHFRREAGRRHLDWIKLHGPLIGRMYQKACMARSLRMMGTMIQTGVAMLEAVELTAAGCGNRYLETLWRSAQGALKQGQQLSEALGGSPLVPRPVVQMIRAGERAGTLGDVLQRIADHCEAELDVAVKTATSMLEPVVIIFLGSVVGTLVIALLLPIFSMSRAMH